jgi:molecular chaperone GrpE
MADTVEPLSPLPQEAPAAGDGQEPSDPAPDPVADPIAALEAEVDRWKDTALRARADLDNYRKRISQEVADSRRFANTALLEELLPILDNFQLGLQAAQNDAAAKNLLVGLNMVAGQLAAFLRDHGVEEVEAVGKPFDPNLHDAVGQEPSDEVPEGTVISQIRRGFKLRERLLRPATVVVSTGPAPAGE